MNINDFSSSGFVNLTRFFLLESAEDAKTLDEFLNFESGEVEESFMIAGPGTYFVMCDLGWDRLGNRSVVIVEKVDRVLTPTRFLSRLSYLKGEVDRYGEPFSLMRDIHSNEDLAALPPEKREVIERMDLEKYQKARDAAQDFLEGY